MTEIDYSALVELNSQRLRQNAEMARRNGIAGMVLVCGAAVAVPMVAWCGLRILWALYGVYP